MLCVFKYNIYSNPYLGANRIAVVVHCVSNKSHVTAAAEQKYEKNSEEKHGLLGMLIAGQR